MESNKDLDDNYQTILKCINAIKEKYEKTEDLQELPKLNTTIFRAVEMIKDSELFKMVEMNSLIREAKRRADENNEEVVEDEKSLRMRRGIMDTLSTKDRQNLEVKEARLDKNINDAFLEANKKCIQDYQTKIETLEIKVEVLETENKELKDLYDEDFKRQQEIWDKEMQLKVAKYKNTIEQKIREATKKHKAYESDVRELDEKIEEKSHQLKEKNIQIHNLEKDIKQVKEMYHKEKEALNNNLKTINEEIGFVKGELQTKTTQVKEIEEIVQSKDTEIHKQKQELDECLENMKKLSREHTTLKKENFELKAFKTMNERWIQNGSDDMMARQLNHANTIKPEELKVENIEWDEKPGDVEDSKQNQNQDHRRGNRRRGMDVIDLDYGSDSEVFDNDRSEDKIKSNDKNKSETKEIQSREVQKSPENIDDACESKTIQNVQLPDSSNSVNNLALEDMKWSVDQNQIDVNSQANNQNPEEQKGVSTKNIQRQPNTKNQNRDQIVDFDRYNGNLVYGICIECKEKKQVISEIQCEEQTFSMIAALSTIPASEKNIEANIKVEEKSRNIQNITRLDSQKRSRIEIKQGSYQIDEALSAISGEDDMAGVNIDSLNLDIDYCLDNRILNLMQKLIRSPNRKEFYLSSSQRKLVKLHNRYFPLILKLCKTTEEIVYLTEFEMTSEQFREIFEHCAKVKKLSLVKCKVNEIPTGFLLNDKLEYKMERFEPRKAIDTKGLRRLARAITKNEKAQNSLKTVLVSKELKKAAENYLGEAGLKVELDLFLK